MSVALKMKPRAAALGIRTFEGASGTSYIVFATPDGAFNVLVETEAKEAALDCGSALGRESNTRQHWSALWK